MTLVTKVPCPCGCKRFMVPPIIDCQEATLSSDEADELVRRWNHFEGIEERIEALRKTAKCYENVQDFGNSDPDAIDEWRELERLTGKKIQL